MKTTIPAKTRDRFIIIFIIMVNALLDRQCITSLNLIITLQFIDSIVDDLIDIDLCAPGSLPVLGLIYGRVRFVWFVKGLAAPVGCGN